MMMMMGVMVYAAAEPVWKNRTLGFSRFGKGMATATSTSSSTTTNLLGWLAVAEKKYSGRAASPE